MHAVLTFDAKANYYFLAERQFVIQDLILNFGVGDPAILPPSSNDEEQFKWLAAHGRPVRVQLGPVSFIIVEVSCVISLSFSVRAYCAYCISKPNFTPRHTNLNYFVFLKIIKKAAKPQLGLKGEDPLSAYSATNQPVATKNLHVRGLLETFFD